MLLLLLLVLLLLLLLLSRVSGRWKSGARRVMRGFAVRRRSRALSRLRALPGE